MQQSTNGSTDSKRTVYIVDGARSPFLKFKGQPGPFSAADLAVQSGRALLAKQPFSAQDIDQVILGCVGPSEEEANIGRVVSLRLGCGKQTPAWTVQRNCASGLQSIDSAWQNIALGRSDLVLAGGTEAMSRAPLLFNKRMVMWLSQLQRSKTVGKKLQSIARFRPNFLTPVIALMKGLTDPVVNINMGQTAEEIAFRFGITRKEMDEFAVKSHLRVVQAQKDHNFDEIEALYGNDGVVYEKDDGVRPDSSVEKLGKLRPVFDKHGSITPGNSSQITDGAAWVILASADAVKKHNLPVLAKIVDVEWGGVDPSVMGLGPVHAITPLLQKNNLSFSDIDRMEINEAFAAQAMGCLLAWQDEKYCKKELGLDRIFGVLDTHKLNPEGGAIAMGHPVGASGARIVCHSAKMLAKKQQKRAVASLCIGGGQGGAILIEHVTEV
jgi:acetyl-CoA C-acetyltransferase